MGEIMNIIPSIIEKDKGSEKIYDLYSRLLKDRIIFITGEITDELANLVVSELLYLDSINNEDINIYINSKGGSVTAGLSIYDTMNYINSNVSTTVIGLAASMASFILAAGTKGKRYALENSEVMIHEVLGGTQGKATNIKLETDRIIKIRDKMNKLLSNLTGKSYKKICKDTQKDFFMSAEEALNYGIIDKIIK